MRCFADAVQIAVGGIEEIDVVTERLFDDGACRFIVRRRGGAARGQAVVQAAGTKMQYIGAGARIAAIRSGK